MQLKYFLRTFGVPNPEFGVESADVVEDKLRSQYLSQGWEVQSTHFLGAVKDTNGHEIGYKIFHVLVKTDQPVTVKDVKASK